MVVSLLEDDEAAQLGLTDERQAAECQSVRFISFPIPDCGVPASTEGAIEAIGRIAAELKAGNNVAVHCRQGVGRSGLITAALLVNSGLHAEQAIEIVSSARGTSVPETVEQRRWIEELPSRIPVANERGIS